RRRHTRWPRDWSSDVCSSDLVRGEPAAQAVQGDAEDDAGLRPHAGNGQAGPGSHQEEEKALGEHFGRQTPPDADGKEEAADLPRSEERRVGKESGSRWARNE